MNDVRGKIFPELWVDCYECRTANATGESKYDLAAKSARRMKWTKNKNGWCCPGCSKEEPNDAPLSSPY